MRISIERVGQTGRMASAKVPGWDCECGKNRFLSGVREIMSLVFRYIFRLTCNSIFMQSYYVGSWTVESGSQRRYTFGIYQHISINNI